MVRRALALVVAVVALSTPTVSLAQWVPDGTPVCTASTQQSEPCVVPDGIGGAIIVWKDARLGATQIFAHHLDPLGGPWLGWTPNGIQVSSSPGAQVPRAVSDGAGGAIILWRGSGGIVAQRITGAGALLWPAAGVRLCTASVGSYEAIADGAGGVIAAWEGARQGGANLDIYARRVGAAGDTLWTGNGVAVCANVGSQVLPTLASDGAGGAIVAWVDPRLGATSNRVFAQRVTAAGGVSWAANGLNAGGANNVFDDQDLGAASDGVGGAFLTWTEFTGAEHRVFAQHLTAAGGLVPGWAAAGKLLAVGSSLDAEPSIVADGSGGCIVAVSSPGTGQVQLQRLAGGGTSLWTQAFNASNSDGPRLAPDGSGGALVAHANNGDMQAGKVSADGSYPGSISAAGVTLCAAAGIQGQVALAATGSDAAIVAWYDPRTPGDPGNIYATQVVAGGLVDVAEPAPGVDFALRFGPNPTAGALRVSFTLPADGAVRLSLVDVAGRTVFARTLHGVAGAQSLAVDEAGGLRPGLYFLRLQQGTRSRTGKFVVTAAR